LGVRAGERIRLFIERELDLADTVLEDDTPLLNGILDSLGLMQLVAFIEEEFDLTLDFADVTIDHFRTLGDLERLVMSRLAAG
jgi:acyl carrier protein